MSADCSLVAKAALNIRIVSCVRSNLPLSCLVALRRLVGRTGHLSIAINTLYKNCVNVIDGLVMCGCNRSRYLSSIGEAYRNRLRPSETDTR